MEEVAGDWRKLHCVELHDPFFLPNTIRVIKSRRMKLLGHVARIGERRGACRNLVGHPEKNIPLGSWKT
jgi:hypothetical protein